MKKLCLIVLVLLTLLVAATAETPREVRFADGIVYSYAVLEDGTAEIVAYPFSRPFSGGVLTVPAQLDGHPVSRIGEKGLRSFYANGSGAPFTVVIPEGVVRIGDDAFPSDMTAVVIPDSVTDIGRNPFVFATRLTDFGISEDHPAFRTENGALIRRSDNCLIACLPSAVSGEYTIPDSVERVGARAFDYCGITAFRVSPEHPSLEAVDGVLYDRAEHRLIAYPRNREGASFAIPEGTVSVGEHAFCSARYLWELSIPDSVTVLMPEAFSNCTHLHSVAIGAGVTEIGTPVFYDSRTAVTVAGGNPCFEAVDGMLFRKADRCLVYWFGDGETLEIPSGTAAIGDWAFSNNMGLTHVLIPDSVTRIGDWAFYRCMELTDLVIPNSVTDIGDSAFRQCASLGEVRIPDSVARIGAWAFAECNPMYGEQTGLTRVTLPAGIEVIGDYAFLHNSSLTAVTFSTGDATGSRTAGGRIGDHAFGRCERLTVCALPEGISEIGASAFAGSFRLTPFTIPASVTAIGAGAFGSVQWEGFTVAPGQETFDVTDGVLYRKADHCLIAYPYTREAETFTIPRGTAAIAPLAFNGAFRLRTVVIPDSVKTVGDMAFANCVGLETIDIPNGVTELGSCAFYWCRSLTRISLPASLTRIGDGVFLLCGDGITVKAPRGSEAAVWAAENGYACEYIEEPLIDGMFTYVLLEDGTAEVTGLADPQLTVDLRCGSVLKIPERIGGRPVS